MSEIKLTNAKPLTSETPSTLDALNAAINEATLEANKAVKSVGLNEYETFDDARGAKLSIEDQQSPSSLGFIASSAHRDFNEQKNEQVFNEQAFEADGLALKGLKNQDHSTTDSSLNAKGLSSLVLSSERLANAKLASKTNERGLKLKLTVLSILILGAVLFYLFAYLNPKFFDYAMSIRIPKLLGMSVAAICIGASSLIFQTLINNYIVTPCLLGMNSLYLVLHTLLVFIFGMGSFIITNKNLAFICDLALMGSIAVFVYNYLFVKTRYNVLYVLLIGTVMTTFFTSIQSTIVRSMDPNDYDALLTTIVASFTNVNANVLGLAVALVVGLTAIFYKQLRLLNVISLGRENAISLGVDYERTLKYLLMYVTLMIAIATALVGPVSFMGLITTNLARQMFKTYKHKYLILGTVLVTLFILIAGQALIERVFIYSVPITVFITIGGGVYFLFLVLKSTKSSI